MKKQTMSSIKNDKNSEIPISTNKKTNGLSDSKDSANIGSDKKCSDSNSIASKEKEVVEAIKTVYDPEIPVDVYSLGLIYKISIIPTEKIKQSDEYEYNVHVLMTLTSPNCPAAETIPMEMEQVVKKINWTGKVTIEITFDPPYDPDMMSPEAKLELGF